LNQSKLRQEKQQSSSVRHGVKILEQLGRSNCAGPDVDDEVGVKNNEGGRIVVGDRAGDNVGARVTG
jgi:hypothetical protein